jgi:hypothetical protein
MVDITLPRAIGSDGVSPVLTAGSVTVGPLAVSITGTQANPVLNFVIPAGSAPPWAISDTTDLQAALDAKASTASLASYAPLASPTFTGTVSGITAAMVGLGNVSNLAPANLPVSTATQSVLDLKAPLSGATLTSATVNGVTLSTAQGTGTFLRGDGTYAAPPGGGGGTGDVVGPASATDSRPALFDGTTGKLLKVGPVLTGTNTGDQTITLTGEATGTGTGSFAVTLTNASVIGKVLTGYSSAAGTVAATDTIVAAIGKLNGNDALKAPIASPTFTGTPAAPTAAANTSTTQLATTAFATTADNLRANKSDTINAQTGTTYTIVAGDNGNVIELNNASAVTVTAPVLTSGFNVLLRQTGAGQVTVVGSSVTIRNRQSYTKLAGQWAEASLSYRATNDAVLSGDVVA